MDQNNTPHISRRNLRKLVSVLREIHAEIIAGDAPDQMFSEFTRAAMNFREMLSQTPRRTREYNGHGEENISREGDYFHYGELIDFSPIGGAANPIAPPMRVYSKDRVVAEADVIFSDAYEGAPGIVHGGFIAAVFDEILGIAQYLSGEPGLTGTLSIRYNSPCPINTNLHLTGRVTRIEGRKKFSEAAIFNGNQLLAEAEAIFIILKPGKQD